MAKNPNRWPQTPEGLAAKARSETKNAQAVSIGGRPQSKLFTKEQLNKDLTTNNSNQDKKSIKSRRKSQVDQPKTPRSTIKTFAQRIIEYSQHEDNLDMHGCLRVMNLAPRTFFDLIEKDPELATAYDIAKSNFAHNNLMFLRKKMTNAAHTKSIFLHSTYSDFLRAEKRKDRLFDTKIALQAAQELISEKKQLTEASQVTYRIIADY